MSEMSGNFGFERGHYDVSVACAEDKLLPALRQSDPATLVVADGFSCRTQIRDLCPDRRPLHTAQVLAAGLPAASVRTMPAFSGVSAGRHARSAQEGHLAD